MKFKKIKIEVTVQRGVKLNVNGLFNYFLTLVES